jgi:hypothetical protein
MTRALLHWFWSLASQDMALMIGLGFIALAIVIAVLRKVGDWS